MKLSQEQEVFLIKQVKEFRPLWDPLEKKRKRVKEFYQIAKEFNQKYSTNYRGKILQYFTDCYNVF